MLNHFNLFKFAATTASIRSLRLLLEDTKFRLGGGAEVDDNKKKAIIQALESAKKVSELNRFQRGMETADAGLRVLYHESAPGDYSTVWMLLRSVEHSLLRDASDYGFIQIKKDRMAFFPDTPDNKGEKRFTFGQEVSNAFPSAANDINEAGYCLAVEANTGAVYHLMCAVEYGLRALAKDRRVVFKKGPIEFHQWGQIIGELEAPVAAINQWRKSEAREVAAEFYNKALKDCRYFNEAYRRHIAHARRHYDRHEALSAMTHAREFMRRLANMGVSEKKRTPLVWKRIPRSSPHS